MLIFFCITGMEISAQEKIQIKRRSTSNLNERGEETSVSARGPILLSAGALGIFRYTSLTSNSDGGAAAGGFALRAEAMMYIHWLATFDLGYFQSRNTVREDTSRALPYAGNLLTDYFSLTLNGGARYALANLKWPRFAVGAKWLRPVSAYALLGPMFMLRSTSQLALSEPNSESFNFSAYANGFVLGLNATVGFDVRLGAISALLEFAYVRALMPNYRNTVSRVLIMPENNEHGFEVRLCVKMPSLWLGGGQWPSARKSFIL